MTFPVLRLPTPEDADQLTRLTVLMQKEFGNIPQTDVSADSRENIRRYFIETLDTGNYAGAVAVSGVVLVSMAGLLFYRCPPSLAGGSGIVAYIMNVYTVPEWRRHRIATELIKMTIKQAKSRGADKVCLRSRETTKGLYEAVGFEQIGYLSLELNFKPSLPLVSEAG